MAANVTIVDCKRDMSSANESLVCGESNVNKNISGNRGDSGGPIACHLTNHSKPVLFGVTSYLINNSSMTFFTSTAFYRNWIKEISGV